MHDALSRLVQAKSIQRHPLHSFCAAISVGVVSGLPVLDLPYVEDSTAEVDMNVVMTKLIGGEDLLATGDAEFVEVQGTAEGAPFSRGRLDAMLDLAQHGITEIMSLQAQMIAEPPRARPAASR